MATEAATQALEVAQQIPSYLIYETLNGRPLYRKGYKEVLAKRKTPGEIMGCSDLQAIIVSTLRLYLGNHVDRKAYWVVTNEPGLHLRLGDNLSKDIALYEKEKVTVKGKFFDVAPRVVVEVDIKVDLEAFPAMEQDYIYAKTQAMLNFGTERVIWITTQSRKIFVATQGENWLTLNWDATVPVLDTVTLNVAAILTEEGVL
ncbi:PDDEXK family nuclease [Spirosoma endbachense]|uniref:Uma2 family endonuclease n=1 Tax=Spirosoma endbachense TaxID=2666025 RepID=A0A6P1VRW1_9BACT|nr:Uma2 family endonuclease [Spirosoma endbachense]QHV94359.1 Uma2 family endonuclease [Spirosoma endbachense]